ncbi:MAG: hypothetical protein WC314_07555 [Vulcanimicrobiota bacterium]
MSAQLSENDELVLGPWGGLLAGLAVGGGVWLGALPVSGLEFSWSSGFLPWLFFAVMGLLYGACQLRVPVRGLIAVGVFYGVFLWVLTNLVGWLLFPASAAQLRSWPGFGLFILFSTGLGLLSVLASFMGGGGGEKARH